MQTAISHPKVDITKLDQTGELIGNTPLVRLAQKHLPEKVKLFAKLEWQQLGGSVKARPAYQIMRQALLEGHLANGKHLLDASSGNTAIAYAAIGARLEIPVTICLPENASIERKLMLKSLGAKLIMTSPLEGTDGAQEKARELVQAHPDQYFYADQYNNDHNWKAHYYGTAKEIYHQTNGQITHFVAGLGTTGTFSGVTRKLREVNPSIQCISVQPESSMHGLEGWKHLETARVPGIYDHELADEHRRVSTEEGYRWMQTLAREEGLLVSPSSGAAVAASVAYAQKLDAGVMVTILPDDASKYGEIVKEVFDN